MLVLLLKLVLAPALVVASSLAGRRWGPRVGGVLVCLPVVAGPLLLIVGLEHGPQFAATTAHGALLGVLALAVFCVAVALLSRRVGPLLTMLGAWVAVLATDLLLVHVNLPDWVAVLLVLAALHATGALLKRLDTRAPAPTSQPPWWDLPARAVATALLVVLLAGLAGALGPTATGILAPFPVAQSVLCAFGLLSGGHAAVTALLRGIVPGLDGFALFLFVLAATLDPLGSWPASGLALLASAATATVLLVVPHVRKRSKHEPLS